MQLHSKSSAVLSRPAAGYTALLTPARGRNFFRASWLLVLFVLAGSNPRLIASERTGGRDTAHYTADNSVDFLHMRLDIRFALEDFRDRRCQGQVTWTVRARSEKIDVIRLNAVGLAIRRVLANDGLPLEFSNDDQEISVRLRRPLGMGETAEFTVEYSLDNPEKGMHFIRAASPATRPMIYTMSEPEEARYWAPCHDWPNERWTSDFFITVPDPFKAVANGRLVETKADAPRKATTFHWRNDAMIDPHLMGFAVGELVELRTEWRGKPVFIFTQPGSEASARFTFERVPRMLEFFTRLTRTEFPFESYGHVTVIKHHHGGMEHAGFSFVNPDYTAENENGEWPREQTESWLIAHMLAHQWFGGLANYRSVSQAWLNEGFAMLLDRLWTAHTDSPDRFDFELAALARHIASTDSSETGKPMVRRDLADLEEIYQFDGGKIYMKGLWVLQMLRAELGETVFWQGVRDYLEEHRWQSVETTDLRQALEKASGRDLEQFFQQWVYGRGIPHLEVSYAWELSGRRARIGVRQTQKIDSTTPAFSVPLPFYFRLGGQDRFETVFLRDREQQFAFDFPVEPSQFVVDPHGALLKSLSATVPREYLRRQLLHGPTALARGAAAEALNHDRTSETIAMLQTELANETEFWGARAAAADALGRSQTGEALSGLLRIAQLGTTHPRVLGRVLAALGEFPDSADAHETVLKYVDSKQPLWVEQAAVAALASFRRNSAMANRTIDILDRAARKPTRRYVRAAAWTALGQLANTNTFQLAWEIAQPSGDEMRPRAIQLLGTLGREESLRERVRRALISWLSDPDAQAQHAAIAALGALQDPKALADLERFSRSAAPRELRDLAKETVERLRHPSDPKALSTAMQQRVDDLDRRNRALEQRLEALEKQQAPTKKSAPDKRAPRKF